MDSSIKALHKNIAEWLAGPTGAVVFHVLLLLALLFWVDLAPRATPPETVEFHYVKAEEPPLQPDPPSVLQAPSDWADEVPAVTPPDAEPDVSAPPDVMDFTRDDPAERPEWEIPPIESAAFLKGFVPGSIQGRIGEEAHAQAGRIYGGPGWEHAEVAVKRALEWLRVNQNADGTWGTHDREAMTGLGILTFLAHGETTSSERYGETVQRALRHLLGRQNERGEFAQIDTTAGTYSQAICVYAISEAYGMTRIPSLKPAMEKGVAVLISGQQSGGGYDYKFARGARRDTSLGGWCCQALKAAFVAGAGNPELKPAMDRAVADLKSVQKEDGSFYYSKIGASHSTHGITAVAVLSMQLLGHGSDAEARKGLRFLDGAACDWKAPPEWPMYAWYYISQTKFHQGGAHWTRWNNQFAPQLIRNQNPDGSWTSAGLALQEGATGRENMHPVYSTTLAALTLQVYYRFLPTYQPIEQQAVQPPAAADATVEIL